MLAAIYPAGPAVEDKRYSPLDDDEVAVKFIRQEFQEFDLGLYGTKWFDYRHMTPLQATRLYIEAFSKVYRDTYARELDRERAQYIRGLDLDDMLEGLEQGSSRHKSSFVGCWRGRQVADALGMPYEVYISLIMDFRMRRWQRAKLPRPCHLYHEYDVEKTQKRWEEIQTGALYLSSHPAYLVENYAGVPHQNDYIDWLFKQASLRPDPAFYLAGFVSLGQMTMDVIRSRAKAYVIEEAERYLSA